MNTVHLWFIREQLIISPWETCCRGDMASPSVCMWLWNWKIASTNVPSIVKLCILVYHCNKSNQIFIKLLPGSLIIPKIYDLRNN